jgi:hypothetical protein
MRRSVIAFALLLVVAGCGGDPQASPTPTPSMSTASPVSTTPSPPAMPDAARANTKAGAIAFVRHYIDLINYAQATGDVGPLAAVEDAGCKSCTSARDGVRKHYASGGTVKGGNWHIRSASAIANGAISGWVVDLAMRFDRQVVSFGDSLPDKVNPASRNLISVQVSRNDDTWKVLQWTRGN